MMITLTRSTLTRSTGTVVAALGAAIHPAA